MARAELRRPPARARGIGRLAIDQHPGGTPLDEQRSTAMTDVSVAAGRATFTNMANGTVEDWKAIGAHAAPFHASLVDRVIDHLRLLADDHGGFAVTRLEHSVQTATRAHRAGRDDEYVVC